MSSKWVTKNRENNILEIVHSRLYICVGMGWSILVKLEFEDVGFCGGRKRENMEQNPQSRTRTNNKLNPHMAVSWNQTKTTLVGRECSQHCAIPAPPKEEW